MSQTKETVINQPTVPIVKWGAIAAVIVSVTIYFLSQGIGAVLISLYPLLQGMSRLVAINWLETSITAQFAYVVVTEIASILLLYSYLHIRSIKFSALGFSRLPNLKDFGFSLVALGLYFPTTIAAISFTKVLMPDLNIDQKQQIGFEQINSRPDLLMTLIGLVILPPIVEEIIARGFLYPGLKKQFPKWLAIIITSLLFALAHLQFASGQPLLWTAAIDTFILSIFLCQLKDITGSLWSSIGLHMLKNSTAFIFLFLIRT